MEKNRAVPKGYMTVGEVAKKMNVTVRTLQYYDRSGLFSPSLASEGGRRLYTDKDVIRLHQILSMKHLGFSLEKIKNCLVSLETPEEMAGVLTEQAEAIREKLSSLSEALEEIEVLKTEVLQMQQVDFKKYADIIVNLQLKNEYYWLIKHFDDKTLDFIRNRFDKESGLEMISKMTQLQKEAVQLQKRSVLPESEVGQEFAKAFWDMIMTFTGGDMSILPALIKMGSMESVENEWGKNQAIANAFIGPALDCYFKNVSNNPVSEEIALQIKN